MNPDLGEVALLVAVIVPSVILHEVSHGWAALAFGDDTAKRAGRLTLNPVAHIDPFGTVILPLLLALSGFGVFGFAKPVPVNPRRMRNPRQHSLYVSLAGPAMNIAIAMVAAAMLRSTSGVLIRGDSFFLEDTLFVRVLFFTGLLNVLLALFNLLPIPPLDGSAVVERLLPERWLPRYHRLRAYSMVGLLVVVLFVLPRLDASVAEPALWVWGRFL